MQERRGVILVVVLVVVIVLTLSVFAFSRFMLAQYRGTHTQLRQTQVRLLAESGVEYLRVMLLKDEYTIVYELGGLYDNPDLFCGHVITDGTIGMTGFGAGNQVSLGRGDPRDIGRVSVIAPALNEDGLLTGDYIRYGLEDESTKLNLRWVLAADLKTPGYGRLILMRLPGVTEEIADSILDWIDDSSYEPREFGAKDEYYESLDPPHFTRMGIPDSLDELLLVRGVSPKLLYGVDWNRNGVVDLGEPGEHTLDEFDVINGSLNLGLISYLTLDSRESMMTPDGYRKINVNMEDVSELRALLEEVEIFADNPDWTNYIISFRQQAQQQAQQGGEASMGDVLGALLGGGTAGAAAMLQNTDGKINSLLDLIGGQGSPFADDPDEMNDYLPFLYDNLTTSDTPIVGRININQASRTVLELFVQQDDELTEATIAAAELSDALLGTSLTSMDAWEIIDGIIAWREMNPSLIEYPEMNYPFWPYTHGIITDLAVMRQLEPYFCTQGAVFKATVVGRFDEQSPVCRLEVWLDASEGGRPARIIRFRDISDLGPGYSAELLGADELFAR